METDRTERNQFLICIYIYVSLFIRFVFSKRIWICRDTRRVTREWNNTFRNFFIFLTQLWRDVDLFYLRKGEILIRRFHSLFKSYTTIISLLSKHDFSIIYYLLINDWSKIVSYTSGWKKIVFNRPTNFEVKPPLPPWKHEYSILLSREAKGLDWTMYRSSKLTIIP